MTNKVLVLAVLVAAAMARPELLPGYVTPAHPSLSYRPSSAPAYHDIPSQYNSQYAVRDDYSGNDFGHQESRNGYDTQGTYYVQLPDGRLQKVTYYVTGDSGYVAEVSYEGEAQYPAYQPASAYKPAFAYKPAPAYRPAYAYEPSTVYA